MNSRYIWISVRYSFNIHFEAHNRKKFENRISIFSTRDKYKDKVKGKDVLFINLNIDATFSV